MSMAMYRTMMFAVFFNYAMIVANFIATLVFPDSSTQVATNGVISSSISNLSGMMTTLVLTAGVLALFAFSLLIPTISFVIGFFALSGIVTLSYVSQIPLPCPCDPLFGLSVFSLPIYMGVLLVYYMGVAQYSARSTFQGS